MGNNRISMKFTYRLRSPSQTPASSPRDLTPDEIDSLHEHAFETSAEAKRLIAAREQTPAASVTEETRVFMGAIKRGEHLTDDFLRHAVGADGMTRTERQKDTAHHASGLDDVTGGTGVGATSLPSVEPVAEAGEVERLAQFYQSQVDGDCIPKDGFQRDIAKLCSEVLRLIANQRTVGFCEACEICGTPRMYADGQRGSIDGCEGIEYPSGERGLIACPIRVAAMTSGIAASIEGGRE